MRKASRRDTTGLFGFPEAVAGLPQVRCGGVVLSPDGKLTYCAAYDQTGTLRASRASEDAAFVTEATNPPACGQGKDSFHPVAVANNGSLIFTWLTGGQHWLAGARIGKDGKSHEPAVRLMDLKLNEIQMSNGIWYRYWPTLSADARLLIVDRNDGNPDLRKTDMRLNAMRVPDDVRSKILEILK